MYFRLEEPHHDLEFLLTLVEYDRWGNIHRYIMEQVHPMEVKEDWEDHSGMSSEEIEVYQIFLNELELTSKEESDNSSEDMS